MPAHSAPGSVQHLRCWTVVADQEDVDVAITAQDCDALGTVVPALAGALGVTVERLRVDGLWDAADRLPDDLPLTAPRLAHGAVLGLGRAAPRRAGGHDGSSALELHVIGGPDAGSTLPVARGEHVLGRGSAARVALDDPDVSRRHVAVRVGAGAITVADLGSTNGSRLDGDELTGEPRPWPVGGVLRLGTTAVTIAGPTHTGVGVVPAAGGRSSLRPGPRLDLPAAQTEVHFPRPPAPSPRRRLAWVAVALPALGGVLMAWLMDAPTFLFFALLSPVVAVGTWLSDRWTGRRSARREAAEHRTQVAAAQDELVAAVRNSVRTVEAAHPDLATLVTTARWRTRLLWSRAGEDGDAVTVRLGVGHGVTGVTRVDGDGTRERQTARHVPVVVDLRRNGGLTVVGPQECTAGVLRSVVVQLAVLLPPGSLDLVLLLGPSGSAAWQWARWLPQLGQHAVDVHPADPSGRPAEDRLVAALTQLTARHRAANDAAPGGREAGHRTWTVVVVDRPVGQRLAAVLRDARAAGVLTLTRGASLAAVPVLVEASLRLSGETGTTARLCQRGTDDVVLEAVDRLPAAAALEVSRDLAGLLPPRASHSLPRSVRLLDIPADGLRVPDDPAAEVVTGEWPSGRNRLVAVLGRNAEGAVSIDLCRDGPHALVAGTTGSGKSELLQTLIAGLALGHPPAACSFLLVDYKGGAAFAEAASLPHTVGVLTDLDGQTTARALRSLTAELTRREKILAEHGVADLADLSQHVELARLVIVVDEFATLADELPSFVPGLVSIAQRGRSLGVHLVLATQRPGGVVSPEIRANCSLRICLRTTDEADSRDVLGVPSAAHLPADLPGRALLRTGSGAPALLQVARVASTGRSSGDLRPDVRRWLWPASPAAHRAPMHGESDLSRVTRALTEHALATGHRPPHRPWCPPLPDSLTLDGCLASTTGDDPPTRLVLGLVDLPDSQRRHPLVLDLAEGGTWLAVGGPRSGRSTLLRSIAREAASRLPANDLHIHLIESGGGSLGAELVELPHHGTVISGTDRLRTARLVERLGEEIASRRASPGTADRPRILLLVDGIDEVTNVLEEALPGHGSVLLGRLLRDGAAAGLTCVATADRAVPGGRLAGLAGHRLVLPLGDRADYAVAGVPPRSVPGHRPPGRALFGEDYLECQIAVPRDPWQPIPTPARGGRRPLVIPELPADPVLPLCPPAAGAVSEDARMTLVVGPGGDEGHPLAVDLSRTGGLLVAGPPGSGRTTALEAFAADLHRRGVAVLRVGSAPPIGTGPAARTAGDRVLPTDDAALRAWLDGLDGTSGVVLVDDVGAPAECAVLSALARSDVRVAVVAAGQAAQLATHFQGPVAALRRARTGLLLRPGPGDADVLGVRLPRTPLPARPGSGWLVTGGDAERVQVARHRSLPAETG